MSPHSSRDRYEKYRLNTRQRRDSTAPRGPAKVEESDRSSRSSRTRSFRVLLWQFWGLLAGHRRAIVVALATLTVATLLKLAPPAATKLVIDYALTDHPLPTVWAQRLGYSAQNGVGLTAQDRLRLLLILTGAVAVISLAATWIHLWGRWYATKAVNKVQVLIRRRVFAHALRLPLHRVYGLKSGGASSLVREDAGGAAELIFSMIYNPWRAVIQLLGSLVILVYVDWRLMLGAVLLLPVVYITHRTWISRIRPLHRDIRAQRQEVDSHATEAFGGIRIVRTFARERSETRRFVLGNNLMVRQQIFVWWWTRIIEIIWGVMIPLASTGLLLYGGWQIIRGELTLGDLTMFLFYLTMLLDPLATLTASAATFQNNLAGLDRVLDLLEETPENAGDKQAQPISRAQVQGQLTFRNVSFRYPGSQAMVLKDVQLQVAAGETIALVGRSGAGKTTLCNLAARFYDPTEGAIELDGRDLRGLRIEDYRRLLGIVEQDVFLFDGPIRDNIGYAVRNPSQQEIERAAQAAHAHEFIIDLEHGYDTIIGERGVRLSGGQRQRLAIARALLADPRILILDEATSNLDTESERLIQESLRTLLAQRTCFVIAHRLSTVAHADRIVVLEAQDGGGRIVEIGAHDELLSRSTRYRRMVEIQTYGIG